MKNWIWCSFLFTGCTINMIQTDTHGVASDVVDSDPQTEAEVSPTISAPIKPV